MKSLEDGRKNSRGVYDGAFEEAEDNPEDTSEDVSRHNKKKDGKNRKTISSRECEIGGRRITVGENSVYMRTCLRMCLGLHAYVRMYLIPVSPSVRAASLTTYVDLRTYVITVTSCARVALRSMCHLCLPSTRVAHFDVRTYVRTYSGAYSSRLHLNARACLR